MSNIFSEEMKKEIIKLFDKRMIELKINEALNDYRDACMGIDLRVKEVNDRLVDVEDNTNDLENQFDNVATKHDLESIHKQLERLEDYVQHDELKDMVGQTMLKLMPNFKITISKEIKRHLVTIADYVIKNFKEKE